MTEDIFSMTQNVSISGTNESSFTSEDIYVEDLPLRLLKALLILIVIMAATVGNAICITVVLKTELLRVPAGNFMISLAIADFCLGMFVAPISFTACILGEWVFPDIVCIGMGFVAFYVSSVSVLSLIMLTVDRWISITWPFKYQTIMTMKTSYTYIACIWISLFVIEAPMVLPDVGRFQYVEGVWFCCPAWEENTLYTYIIISVTLFPSCFVVLTLNIYLFCKAKTQIRKLSTLQIRQPKDAVQFGKISLLKSVFVTFTIVIVFVLCWLPYFVVELLNFYNIAVIHQNIRFLTNFVASTNSFLNCFIYYFMNRNFRKGARRLFRRKPTPSYI